MLPVQTYALYYWSFHYFKRILETFFVHRFSHATSPVSNVYRNCSYYWTFAAFIAYNVNHPLYSPVSELQWKIGFIFGLIFQFSNLYCHIILKQLRSSDGVGGYQIPQGFLFNFVTCANYTTEIYQWLGFNIATQTLTGYLFLSAHGCGEGRAPIGRKKPTTPWGYPALGRRSRKRNKYSDSFILRRRK